MASSLSVFGRSANRTPDGEGRGRHLHVANTLVPQRIGDRIDDGRRRTDRTCLPATLDTQRIMRTRRTFHRLDLQQRQVVGARHRIVHEATRDQLTVLVVAAALEQSLAKSLRYAP